MPTVYHYTNKAGHDAIKRTRYIAKSRVDGRDAVFGDGVYLTDLSPEYDKIKVAKNCWGTAYKSALQNGKLDYVIEIDIPKGELQEIEDGERIILLYRKDLVLGDYQYDCMECKWKNN